MAETNFQKYEIDSAFRVLKELPVKTIKVSNYVPQEKSGITSLLPGVNAFFEQMLRKVDKQKNE